MASQREAQHVYFIDGDLQFFKWKFIKSVDYGLSLKGMQDFPPMKNRREMDTSVLLFHPSGV